MGQRHTELIVTDPASGAVQFRAYRVQVVAGPDAGKEVRLERGSIIVGTADDADLALTDGAVSRTHVKLVPFSDGVEVIDLESKNGTFSSGMRVAHARLSPGAELSLGRTTLRLVPEDRAVEVPPSSETRFVNLRGHSRQMRELFSILELVSPREAPVLIEGDPGSGKTRAAKAIHAKSPLARARVHLIEGAAEPNPTVVLEALSTFGTVLIRHIEQLEPTLQRELARAIEDGRGAARVLATSRKDLEREVAQGRFDRPLFLRLGVVRVRIPPLRDRGSDIPVLIEDILEELGRPPFVLGPADLGRLQAYAWPDNVRELRTVIERAVSLDSIRLGNTSGSISPPLSGAAEVVGADLPYKQARAQMIEAFEREYVRGLLATHDGNISKAARAAGIDRVYLHRLIRKYDL